MTAAASLGDGGKWHRVTFDSLPLIAYAEAVWQLQPLSEQWQQMPGVSLDFMPLVTAEREAIITILLLTRGSAAMAFLLTVEASIWGPSIDSTPTFSSPRNQQWVSVGHLSDSDPGLEGQGKSPEVTVMGWPIWLN